MATIFFTTLICLSIILSPIQALQQGFTTDLIHRDSPLSPSYNPSLSQWDRLGKAIRRSIARINHFRPSNTGSPNDFQTPVRPAMGEYLMEFSLGTPPSPQLGIADTGSDLIWVQCQPCLECYKQDLPIFNPKKSSTFDVQPCESKACDALDTENKLCSKQNTCEYRYAYGDQSHTTGDLATETITFKPSGKSASAGGDDTGVFPKVAIGCGHDNAGTFKGDGSGLVGLGGGPLSLVSQLSSSIEGKFSYCLIPFFDEAKNLTSTLNFGANAKVSGSGVVSTPLVKGSPNTFYFLTLKGLSIGKDKFVPFKSSSSLNQIESEGNIIIDSGTTLTLLPPDVFSDLVSSLDKEIHGTHVDDPQGVLQLCYKSSNGGKDLNIPSITAHFTDADLVLQPVNTFIQVAEGVICLAMIPADNLAIFGNVAQSNFLVGYDIEAGTVSFKPTDCTKA